LLAWTRGELLSMYVRAAAVTNAQRFSVPTGKLRRFCLGM
jgi:hypothetical protein